jgi:hypothetical protein
MASYGELYVADNTTAVVANATPTKYATGWTARGLGRGDLTVTEGATAGTLTCVPGVYEVWVTGVIETEDTSATSGDDVGVVTVQVYKDGVAVAGVKTTVDLEESDRALNFCVHGHVEVDSGDAGALAVYLSSGDASGNDVTVKNCQFTATLVQ